jgi:hypothetical protein
MITNLFISFVIILCTLSATGCRPRSSLAPVTAVEPLPDAAKREQGKEISELKKIFPIHLGDPYSALPKTTLMDNQHSILIQPTNLVGENEDNVSVFILSGRFEGVMKVKTLDGKVTGAEFAWGNRQVGQLSKFVKVY